MSKLFKSTKLQRFWRQEDGLATFEACIWTPFFLFFLVLLVDVTMIFAKQGQVHRIVQDGQRQYILRQENFATTGELETWVETEIAQQNISPNAVATSTIDANDILSTTVTYPSADTDLSGATGLLSNLTMRVTNYTLTETD